MKNESESSSLQIVQVHNELYNDFEYIHKILVHSNIKYWLVGGSLLGQVRGTILQSQGKKYTPGIIPWDDDIDIGINVYDIHLVKKKLAEDSNYSVRVTEHGLKLKHKTSKVGIDIFGYKSVLSYHHNSLKDICRQLVENNVTIWILASEVSRTTWPRDYFLYEEICEVVSVPFGPTNAFIPVRPLRYLHTVYGDNCMTVGKREFNHIENKLHPNAGIDFAL